VVHNGVTSLKQNIKTINTKPQVKIVTFLGRITFQKGPDYFIEAAKKVLLKHPETRFVMAGNGDMLKDIIKRVAKLRLSSRFHFTGFLKNTETTKIFEISNVYVMPSVSEPFGISPLEAVNSGVPVIISKQSGVSEVLKNALKVDFWDTDALAEAICAILNHQSLASILKNGASKEIEQLQWKKSAKNVKKLYASVIKNNLVQTKF
jgi:glycosyltransferase involved in cell wall biosynthesis